MFFNQRAKHQDMALCAAAGIVAAYLLFNYPLTLLVGLMIAASFYTSNEPRMSSGFRVNF